MKVRGIQKVSEHTKIFYTLTKTENQIREQNGQVIASFQLSKLSSSSYYIDLPVI